MYPIILQSFLLVENNTYKNMAIRIKSNKLDSYSATPNFLLLPPKGKSIIKFQYYLRDIDEDLKHHKFRFEALKIKDTKKDIFDNPTFYKIDELFNRELQGLNIQQSATGSLSYSKEKSIISGLPTTSGTCEYFFFEKSCRLDIVFSNQESTNISVNKTDSKEMLIHSKSVFINTEKFENKGLIGNSKKKTPELAYLIASSNPIFEKESPNKKEIKDLIDFNEGSDGNKSRNFENNNLTKEILPKNLRKEADYLNEKLSNLKFECNRLEKVVSEEANSNKEKFKMLSKCKFITFINFI